MCVCEEGGGGYSDADGDGAAAHKVVERHARCLPLPLQPTTPVSRKSLRILCIVYNLRTLVYSMFSVYQYTVYNFRVIVYLVIYDSG